MRLLKISALLAGVSLLTLLPIHKAQAEIKLDVGGYFKAYGGFANQKLENSVRKFDIKRKSELFFDGEAKLDNGLVVGTHTSMFGENNEDQTYDEGLQKSFLYFSGNWGRFNFGREYGAAYLLQVVAPAADPNIDGADPSISFYNRKNAVGFLGYAQKNADFWADPVPDKLTYLTPQFNGWQLGFSYSPDPSARTIGNNLNGMSTDNDNRQFKSLSEAAARYENTFSNGVGWQLGGGYSYIPIEGNTSFGRKSYKEWNIGSQVTYQNFAVGAVFKQEHSASDNSFGNTKDEIWVVGANYTHGDYTFGTSYFETVTKNTDVVYPTLRRLTAGVSYNYAPGMDLRGSVARYAVDDTNLGNIVSTDVGNNATVFSFGTDVSF